MNGKRAYWQLLLASTGMGLLITNCTIKSVTDTSTGGTTSTAGGSPNNAAGTGGTTSTTGGSSTAAAGADDGACKLGTRHFGCSCTGNLLGAQTCLADGSFGACICAMGSTATGGTSSTGAGGYAGSTGGTATAAGGYSGGGGTAGAGAVACDAGVNPTDCYTCLYNVCATQWAACEADNETTVANAGDPYCLGTAAAADTGQIELIMDCIFNERAKGNLVKRDVVRACGATIGDSADPQYFLWAPPEMTPATKALMNCMADAPTAAMPGAWADSSDPASFPLDAQSMPQPAPWPACTCAKMACTSGL